MRLIDADRLLKGYEDHDFIDTHIIYNAPTVEAIPIEWIEIDIEASAFSGYDIHSYEVASMLEEWKEKERKE